MEKNWGDTPSATLKKDSKVHFVIFHFVFSTSLLKKYEERKFSKCKYSKHDFCVEYVGEQAFSFLSVQAYYCLYVSHVAVVLQRPRSL